MTTPQDTLYRLEARINHLTDLFESDENGQDIFAIVNQLGLQMDDIMAAQQRLENLLNLIIGFLDSKL